MDLKRCDACGVLESKTNPVEVAYRWGFWMLSDREQPAEMRIEIKIPIPMELWLSDICRECKTREISKRFAELCGMIAPYQPGRVTGFVQSLNPEVMEQLSKEERKALAILSKRLLTE